jgi:outer membrane protein TolC
VEPTAPPAGITPGHQSELLPLPQTLPVRPTTDGCPTPLPAAGEKALAINLPTALQLTHARAIDIQLAAQRIQVACAQLQRAQVAWLPTWQAGIDYFRHDGRIQTVQGDVINNGKSSFMLGNGPSAVFAVSDALFGPLAARQVVRARQADLQASTNDTVLAVALAYFNVQEARGDLAGAEDAVRRSEDLVRRTEKLAPSLVPPVEVSRVRTELARRRQAAATAREHWRTASAELFRLLRLDAAAVAVPLEPPQLQVTLVNLNQPVDGLIVVGLTNRPELAAQQALVRATVERLRLERLRPLMPSVLLRGAATNPAGTLAEGVFGGGVNGNMSNFGTRLDYDLQVLWQFENLGFGNRARVNERRAEHRLSVLELFRTQDRVAAEVSQAYAEAQSAQTRVRDAADELRNAVDSADKNLEGLGQTKQAGNLILLVIRPQEAVAAVQALDQAYTDYYGALGDFNRAQFRLYRALGEPAQALTHTLVPERGALPPLSEHPVPERVMPQGANAPPSGATAGAALADGCCSVPSR